VWGDADGSGLVDLGDILFLVNYLYKAGLEPNPPSSGDPSNDCTIDLTDILFLVNYLYRGGPAPLQGCA